MNPIRVLVVDDSPVMRAMITRLLGRDNELEVIGQAANPQEARQAIKELNPDVMTLDIEMPGMSGLDFLDRVMRLRPMPVVMVSSLTQRGADESIRALEAGAIDCLPKPSPSNPDSLEQLALKVKAAARARLRRNGGADAPVPTRAAATYEPGSHVVVIGASTGGVEALGMLLASYPANCPPTVIAQHMPEAFLAKLAMRLNNRFAPEIALAVDKAPLVPGRVYLAPGGNRHVEIADGAVRSCRIREGAPVNGHCPSVDVLFQSASAARPAQTLGVILTGIGRDGADGLLALRRAGVATLGQDEATSLVYGMPRVAWEVGAVQRQIPLDSIGAEILGMTQQKQQGRH